jgi:hypothetical protein
MQSVCSYLLVMSMTVGSLGAAERSPAEQARKIKAGSRIEVILAGGQILTGRLGAVSEQGFDLLASASAATSSRAVPFGDVQSLRSKERSTGARIAIDAGVVLAALLVIGLVVGRRT